MTVEQDMHLDSKPSRKEFERLALAQLDTLYRVARRLVRDQAGAEDLVQETYLRALRAADGFRLAEFGIRPWLLRIMQNLFVTRAQREARQPIKLNDQQLSGISDSSQSSLDGSSLEDWRPEDGAASGGSARFDSALFESMDQQLVSALEQLPQEYQIVMLLWAVEELSYKEIAHVIDAPIGTVMSRLHRARQRLGEQLQLYARQQRIIRE